MTLLMRRRTTLWTTLRTTLLTTSVAVDAGTAQDIADMRWARRRTGSVTRNTPGPKKWSGPNRLRCERPLANGPRTHPLRARGRVARRHQRRRDRPFATSWSSAHQHLCERMATRV